jgi:hypothetical protein
MKLANWFFILVSAVPFTGVAQNLASSDSWTAGSGSIGIFNQNGTSGQNVRELGTGPYGTQVMLWKAVPDAANASDGGWDTQPFAIDRTKMYRFSVWIKKTSSTDGDTYFGCHSNNILRLGGTVDTNPYFWYGDLPELNKWYLLVGYVHASDDPSTTNYGGIYDGTTGTKVLPITDFKFSSAATTAVHRTYLYYDVNTSDRQYFYNPEVYQASSNQPIVEMVGSTYSNADAFFSKKVGIGTVNPSGNFHIHSKTAELFLTSEQESAIRGNGGMWLFGYSGAAGSEDISMGTQAGSGSRTLTLAAGGVARVKILSNGNIGIGETNPTLGRLQVSQSSDASDKGIAIVNSTGVRGMRLWTDPTNSYVYSGTTGQANLILNGTGNVGIGTSNPTQKLTVNGIIYGKEVKVNLSVPGPDYVFENDYNLPSLDEIKNYIDQNKHLPEVPSAKEMEINGIQLGEMNMLLLKKVEELTLHLIKKDQEMKELRLRIENLEK